MPLYVEDCYTPNAFYTWKTVTPQTPQLLKWDDDSEEIGLAVSAANNCAQACWPLGSSFVISKLLS